ncbi:hypothetical protein RHMOL_Rhmol09G0251200 [Rhododendron molle]|uniref:Uncharacterized protein n=1 Tax=Rhododendron molle TaxID=49168 RepID=A0ACC0MGW1_RHOML|nr:hypothetical protein RHMOL_Rhmol09G0251200 [Rhododendron molle]
MQSKEPHQGLTCCEGANPLEREGHLREHRHRWCMSVVSSCHKVIVRPILSRRSSGPAILEKSSEHQILVTDIKVIVSASLWRFAMASLKPNLHHLSYTLCGSFAVACKAMSRNLAFVHGCGAMVVNRAGERNQKGDEQYRKAEERWLMTFN